jgi:hypothetical protein
MPYLLSRLVQLVGRHYPGHATVAFSLGFLTLVAVLLRLDACYNVPQLLREHDPDVPVPIEGIITLAGRPVGGAAVSFLPAEDLGRRGAFGSTRPDGTLELSTYALGDGVLPGHYKVLVKRTIGTNVPWLPAVYGDLYRTPLRCQVPPEGRVVLELESDPRP